MIPPIPRLEEYGISPERGFLPSELPLQCLSHPVYDRWERIMNNFQSLLLSKRLRTVIDKLPVIPAVHLETEAEYAVNFSRLHALAEEAGSPFVRRQPSPREAPPHPVDV